MKNGNSTITLPAQAPQATGCNGQHASSGGCSQAITLQRQDVANNPVTTGGPLTIDLTSTAANGLTFDQALRTITIDAAKILGVAERVGSLEVGKDGDVALYDDDPFEYTSHCTACIIQGKVVSDTPH